MDVRTSGAHNENSRYGLLVRTCTCNNLTYLTSLSDFVHEVAGVPNHTAALSDLWTYVQYQIHSWTHTHTHYACMHTHKLHCTHAHIQSPYTNVHTPTCTVHVYTPSIRMQCIYSTCTCIFTCTVHVHDVHSVRTSPWDLTPTTFPSSYTISSTGLSSM